MPSGWKLNKYLCSRAPSARDGEPSTQGFDPIDHSYEAGSNTYFGPSHSVIGHDGTDEFIVARLRRPGLPRLQSAWPRWIAPRKLRSTWRSRSARGGGG